MKRFSHLGMLLIAMVLFAASVTLVYGQDEPEESWVRRYTGPGNGDDSSRAIAIDSDGNVYVTGSSFGIGTGRDWATIAYDSDGNERWIRELSGPETNSYDYAYAIAVDSEGNVYVTGSIEVGMWNSACATISYDSFGYERWIKIYDSPGEWDCGYAIAIDGYGNVYVTGMSWKDGSFSSDFLTIVYDNGGNERWVSEWSGPGPNEDYAQAIAVDSIGNVYVTGTSWKEPMASADIVTVAYDSEGNERWVREYNGSENGDDGSYAIAIDSNGNIFVTGSSYEIGTNRDFTTISYDSEGVERWIRRYNGSEDGDDSSRAIAIDSDGNVYVTGTSRVDSSWSSSDFLTVAYNNSGNELWTVKYNGPGNGRDYAQDIAVDSEGNVYVAGSSLGDGTDLDYATIKYSKYNTPPGDNVVVMPEDPDTGEAPVGLTFDEVTEGGETTLNITETGSPETGFKLGDPPIYYEIETTAVYSGPITICIDYSGISFSGEEENIKLYHQEVGGDWIEITSTVNTEDNIICGTVPSLSIFTIFEPMALDDLIQMVQASSINKGVQNSLVAKLQNAHKSLEKGNIKAAINQIEAFQNEVRSQRGKKIPIDLADKWIEISMVIMAAL